MYAIIKMSNEGGIVMDEVRITKWGNSNGIRIPKSIMEYLHVGTNDIIQIKKDEDSGKRRLIMEAKNKPVFKEMTIQELFAEYDTKGVASELVELDDLEANDR